MNPPPHGDQIPDPAGKVPVGLVGLRDEGDVLPNGPKRPVEKSGAAGFGPDQPQHAFQQGRLAGTIGTDHSQTLTAIDAEAHVVNHRRAAVAHAQAGDPNGLIHAQADIAVGNHEQVTQRIHWAVASVAVREIRPFWPRKSSRDAGGTGRCPLMASAILIVFWISMPK